MKNSALVLEGGANRGIFTAGVLDVLMERKFQADYVVGVSAGACNAVDYISEQPLRSRDCIIAWNQEKMRDQMAAFRKEHCFMDMRLLFDVFPNEKYPFDYDTFFDSPIRCELAVTNCLTGRPEYLSETSDRQRLMKICRASSSIPILSTMVDVDGTPYFDGGLADSIPVLHARKLGYRKLVVVLTQKKGYRKTISKKTIALIRARYRRYPELVKTCCLRPYRYNKCLDSIEKWEAAGKLFVIRPRMQPVSRLEKNVDKLQDFYEHGRDVMREQYDGLLEYLAR